MGSALARAFVGAGYDTTVWNRTIAKAEALAAAGAVLAESVPEAVGSAEIVVVNVSDYAASAALLRDQATAADLSGKLIVELTSGSQRGAREAANWAETQGAAYLDGAIMATPNFIGTDAGTILFSGPRAAFDSNSAALGALGGNLQFVGEDPGIANALDNALLGQMWGALFGVLHAIAICQVEQIDLAEFARQRIAFAPVVEGGASDLVERTRTGRLAGDQDTLASISVHYGAFKHLLEVTEERKLDRGASDAHAAIFERAIAAGRLHDDFRGADAVHAKARMSGENLPRTEK
jgi:3-hydroxyisobutyrate dehydrogenase-like beta-hydroxyacid dehydrogenase